MRRWWIGCVLLVVLGTAPGLAASPQHSEIEAQPAPWYQVFQDFLSTVFGGDGQEVVQASDEDYQHDDPSGDEGGPSLDPGG